MSDMKIYAYMLAAVVLVLCGCGDAEQDTDSQELLVLAGGSFRTPTEQLVEQFQKDTGIAVSVSFGQSEDHLPHVKQHAHGDVFITHDPYATYTAEAAAELQTIAVGYLRPVLVVAKGNPLAITAVKDLQREGVRVALPNAEFSTCGAMVETLLKHKGWHETVVKNVGNAFFRSHGEIARAINMGHRDAGIMWNGVANNWLNDIEIVPTVNEYETIRVTVTGLSYSPKTELIQQFLAYAQEHGGTVFSASGYTD